MKRIPIGLTELQHMRLSGEARRRRRSIGALIRDAVDQVYPDETTDRRAARERASVVLGRFRSGCSEVAERHDHYLDEMDRL